MINCNDEYIRAERFFILVEGNKVWFLLDQLTHNRDLRKMKFKMLIISTSRQTVQCHAAQQDRVHKNTMTYSG